MRIEHGLNVSRATIAGFCALLLPVFTLFEANYPRLAPHAQLAIFAGLGLGLALVREHAMGSLLQQTGDLLLAIAALAVCGYVAVQSDPIFSRWWLGGQSLGERAGAELPVDIWIGAAGLALVLFATRRLTGWALPILSGAFLLYAAGGRSLPDWLLPHRGYGLERIVGQTFLHSQGVFSVALNVMFNYVFLFVLFGALLEATGTTEFIVGAGRRLFRRTVGGPAKVAVFSSGLLGSLSGSAVANTATTGTFTIPMMRSAGFQPHTAAGVEAAASSGGALVPPVMGAGAYMMLELVEPPVTYVEIIRAALIPAILYYLSIFLMVHLRARRLGDVAEVDPEAAKIPLWRYEGVVVIGALGSLVALLLAGFTVFRSVTVAMAVVLALAALNRRTRVGPRALVKSLLRSSQSGMMLIAAAACVGIVVGVVTLTGAGTRLPALILPLAQNHLVAALLVIMGSSLVLGMGLPSAVCYLLLATLIGPVLGRLGVVPLAAHLFVFYFGLMSMVTPPVALAAFTASSIAGSTFVRSSAAAFRYALVGFALPYIFVFRPELLILAPGGGAARPAAVALATAVAVAGIVPLAAANAGFLLRRLGYGERLVLVGIAALLLFPGSGSLTGLDLSVANEVGLVLLAAAIVWLRRRPRRSAA